MSFAILGTKIGALDIENPDCVKKTYPKFWEELCRCETSGAKSLLQLKSVVSFHEGQLGLEH